MAEAPRTVSLAPLAPLLRSASPRQPAFPSMAAVAAAGPAIQYAVHVTNTGEVDADDVVSPAAPHEMYGRWGRDIGAIWGRCRGGVGRA